MYLLKNLAIIALLCCSNFLFAQTKSIHQEQQEYYKQFQFSNEADYNSLSGIQPQNKGIVTPPTQSACSLEYDVYGWHPYWVGTAYNDYDFSLLSTFSYFSRNW